ncbi:hypothetical protein PTKIN_Ptkin09bG0264400 [Pterospermum kingtungense]
MFTVPPGYRFMPTKQEIIWGYLRPAMNGAPFFRGALIEADIYGEEPWKLFDKNGKESFWVLTKLKKKSKSRIERTVGCGCWLGRCTKEINSESGLLLGFDKYFTFACKKHKPSCQGHGQWTMHEYSLKDQSLDAYVICEIKFKKDEVQSKNTKRKSPPDEVYDDEEVSVPSTKKVSAGDYQEISHVDPNMEQISTMTSLVTSTNYQENPWGVLDHHHHQEAQSQNAVQTMTAGTNYPDDFGDCQENTKKFSGDCQESHDDAINMEQISTMTSLITSAYQDNISREVDHHQEAQSQNREQTMTTPADTNSPDDFGDCIVPEDLFFDIDGIMNGLDLEEVISFKEIPVDELSYDDAALRFCEGD